MRPSDIALSSDIEQKLLTYDSHNLPGIDEPDALDCLVRQMVDSVRRIKYIKTILAKRLSPSVADSDSIAFDPLKAAVWHSRQNNVEEAFWLVFLATHFGKNKRTGWRLTKAVYGALGNQPAWTWKRVSANPTAFRNWLQSNLGSVDAEGNFGNHRKYQSLSATSKTGTGAVVESYVDWVLSHNDHVGLINDAKAAACSNPRSLFSYLYRSMSDVIGFGRTGRFDYLTMVGKLELADIEPDSTYMTGATGPLDGAQLLFGGNRMPRRLSVALNDLESHLGQPFGMQVLEDSLCNWQKQPKEFIHFSG